VLPPSALFTVDSFPLVEGQLYHEILKIKNSKLSQVFSYVKGSLTLAIFTASVAVKNDSTISYTCLGSLVIAKKKT